MFHFQLQILFTEQHETTGIHFTTLSSWSRNEDTKGRRTQVPVLVVDTPESRVCTVSKVLLRFLH